MAERFYRAEIGSRAGEQITLEGDEAHHLARVRRVEVGAVVEVFDGRGFATRAEVVSIGKQKVELRPIGTPLPDRRAPFPLTLATAVPKGDRFDWLVEKATELGVDRLVPLLTERSVVAPGAAKIARLRRLVVEASKQCGRNQLMALDDPRPWPGFLQALGALPVRLVAHPGGLSFGAWRRPLARVGAVVAIGPEGGFTDAEIEAAAHVGWERVGLGESVLRIETAALAASARLLALGEWEGEGTDE